MNEQEKEFQDNINKDHIKVQVEEWTYKCIDKDFKFRKYQEEAIIDIIFNIISHSSHNYVIEAPTGSGKSLINIIAAGVLAEYYDLTSYILVSDLFLWEQYETFLKKYPNTQIASLKGQTGNYTCALNHEDMKNADCKMTGLSWSALFNKSTIEKYGYDCAYSCEYVKARKRAIKAKVCIMTYQLFLFIMNNPDFNKNSHGECIFKPHDVLFCDEAHNIPGIVQMQYAPTIIEEHFNKLVNLYNKSTLLDNLLFHQSDIDNNEYELYKRYQTSDALMSDLTKYWKIWSNPESLSFEDYDCMISYYKILELFAQIVSEIKSDISLKKLNGISSSVMLTKDEIQMFKICSWYENYMCHWHDFLNAINATGQEYLLKDVTIANDDGHMSIAFKCTKEDYLVYAYLLSRAPWKVFLSATIGGKEAYDENMGFRFDHVDEESKMDIIPSTFNFEKSPIFFLNKFKMSMKERDKSFHFIKNAIYSICSTKFKDQKGLIQTGSYKLAKELYDNAPMEIKQRMLVYNGSREKNTIIQYHKWSKDTIIVGPTLNQGIDLPGDDCRFIIILKVPYPSLGDKLVKAKLKLFPLWYNSTTSNEIIQGIGRGVRYDGDWCVTYIFDACFWNLYLSTKEQYPKELQERIKLV